MDLQLFCRLLADKHGVMEELQGYAAGLVANLCVTDGEVAERLFQCMRFETDDPITVLAECCQNDFSEARGTLESTEQEPHPFQLLRENQLTLLIRRIWKAQLQIAFPHIELERLQMIEHYRQPLEEALTQGYWDQEHCQTRQIKQFRHVVENPYELELGTLDFMMKLTLAQDKTTPLLGFMEVEDQKRLCFLHAMRNKLAHVYDDKNCTPQDMIQILHRP